MVAKIPLKSKVTIHRLNRKCYKVFKIKRCISGGTLKLTHLSMGEKNNLPKKKERMFIGGAGKSIGRTERIF